MKIENLRAMVIR